MENTTEKVLAGLSEEGEFYLKIWFRDFELILGGTTYSLEEALIFKRLLQSVVSANFSGNWCDLVEFLHVPLLVQNLHNKNSEDFMKKVEKYKEKLLIKKKRMVMYQLEWEDYIK